MIGEITIAPEGRNLILKFKEIDLPMTHWHLDRFLVEYQPWGLREFVEFRVGPDGTIEELELFDESFRPGRRFGSLAMRKITLTVVFSESVPMFR